MRIPSAVLRECWFLTGPTASGKTAVGLELARRLDAEIVALDSMSLYRGMDIGTAKPTRSERARVPHHLVDVLEPHEEFTVAEYVRAAAEVCQQILGRHRTPLFVGGTGLYLRALLRGVFEAPGADWEFRRALETQAAQLPPGGLHHRLTRVDPVTAERLHPNDTRRIIRALEVHHLTGRPASEQQRESPLPEHQRPQHVYWLSVPRERLHERIDRRVTQMIAAGWVQEVEMLLQRPEPLSRTARRALGYDVLIEHLAGRCRLEEAVERIRLRTRQFAKRQHTWFRNLVECRPIEVAGEESPSRLAKRILASASGP